MAFPASGADCLYVPDVREPGEIAAIVKAVAPKPVNVLVSGFNAGLSVSRLADLGVRQISVGSGLALAAWGAFTGAARTIATTGRFDALADAIAFAEINGVFQKRNPS